MRELLRLTSKKKIPTNQIIYLESDRNYTVVHTLNDCKYMSGFTLKILEKRIINTAFVRINKGLLINCEYIETINSDEKEKFLSLKNGLVLPISRRKFSDVKAFFEEAKK